MCVCGLVMAVSFCSKSADKEKTKVAKEAATPPGDTAASNPLLSEFDTPFGVPPFDKLKDEHFMPAFKEGIKRQQQEIEDIVGRKETPTFENTVEALEHSGGLLTKVRNIFYALRGAHTNDAKQKIAQEAAPILAKHRDDIRLNDKLFQRIKAVYRQKDQLNLTTEQNKLLENYYKNFVRGGANLSAEKKEEFRKINKELSLLSVQFSENILKEDNAFKLVIEKKEDLSGLPPAVVQAGAEAAEEAGLKGKWVYTPHKPSMIPFLQFADKRELREKLYKAYINRGDNDNELDNKAILSKIAALRVKRANLLGYASHAEYMLEENMAKKPENVYDLLKKLWTPALRMAKKDAAEFQAMIDKEGGDFKLASWDWWYYAEKMRKARYDLDDNIFKPYFKLENVRDGAFYVANKLFGLKFIERTDIPKYHEDVKTFEVQDADGAHVGVLYTDYFPRASKRGGAWMNALRKQSNRDGKRVYPVITNNGNFSKPTGDLPSLLNDDEVATLFHEFGHALHGLLSDCVYEELSGSDVPIDFVELPSQIMENWAFEPEVLKVYAKHYRTGEVIPRQLVEKIKKSKRFNEGFKSVEYLAASFLDMDWHTLREAEALDVDKFETASLNKIGLIPEIISRYRSTYFNHIFSSGYSAGYYSYIWAEVIDADAFEAFKENGLFDQKTAKAFLEHILSKGGTDDPMTLYKRFRGREPEIKPLLKRKFGIEK